MAFLDSREREVMKLRFIEQWEYHEIAAQAIPIGTVQWRVFNAKKKLAPHLMTQFDSARLGGDTKGFGGHQNDVRYSAGIVFRVGEK